MAMNSDALGPLIEALAEHPAVQKDGLQFSAVSDATVHQVDPSTVLWGWGDRGPGERGKASLAYYDFDGQIVSVGLLAAGNQVTEIELWRGDGKALQSLPARGDLWEMVAGRVYSPRA